MFFIRRFDPEIHHRQSIRKKGWNYSSPGAYFITICSMNRGNFFGTVENRGMNLNSYGVIVNDDWYNLTRYHPHISLDAFVVMPDHIHGIIMINHARNVGAGPRPAPDENIPQSPSGAGHRPAPTGDIVLHGLPEIIRQFKSFSARRINILRCGTGNPVWQRNYYEHIIRSNPDLIRIRNYILQNPENYS
jgi:putative transposase